MLNKYRMAFYITCQTRLYIYGLWELIIFSVTEKVWGGFYMLTELLYRFP